MFVKQKIFGFYIAVDNPDRMQVVKSLYELFEKILDERLWKSIWTQFTKSEKFAIFCQIHHIIANGRSPFDNFGLEILAKFFDSILLSKTGVISDRVWRIWSVMVQVWRALIVKWWRVWRVLASRPDHLLLKRFLYNESVKGGSLDLYDVRVVTARQDFNLREKALKGLIFAKLGNPALFYFQYFDCNLLSRPQISRKLNPIYNKRNTNKLKLSFWWQKI